ncbi:MAG: 2-hydroxychromene-2-carboxylate isomerase [Paraburkholderia sp.]|jgi:2-hydroxychromene-2-carboxylate isomerase|uniref:2-hydroxychromene-2-carboxylate isomerase n=1 Tax=Burkholderiaceae TaxID=119060 RepID=UPI0020176E8F|nr:2-hydroxychromene-2-carboxylate isomerase [Burkholderia sp. 4M9327F10]
MTAPVPDQTQRAIDFWFDFGSNYSYLSVMRIEAQAAMHRVTVCWRPFLLAPVFQALGYETSPFVLQKEKGEYVWKDMERQCRKYALPWRKPTVFPRRALLPLRVALRGADEPWIGAFCRAVMLLNFSQDRDIDSPQAVSEVLTQLGLPAQQLIADALGDDNKLKLREQTAQARAQGVFGAPTFFVGAEMFWGNDRLDEALAFAARPAD